MGGWFGSLVLQSKEWLLTEQILAIVSQQFSTQVNFFFY